MVAASSNSRGTVRKNCRSKKVPYALNMPGRISDAWVSRRFSHFIKTNVGTRVICLGIIMVAR